MKILKTFVKQSKKIKKFIPGSHKIAEEILYTFRYMKNASRAKESAYLVKTEIIQIKINQISYENIQNIKKKIAN